MKLQCSHTFIITAYFTLATFVFHEDFFNCPSFYGSSIIVKVFIALVWGAVIAIFSCPTILYCFKWLMTYFAIFNHNIILLISPKLSSGEEGVSLINQLITLVYLHLWFASLVIYKGLAREFRDDRKPFGSKPNVQNRYTIRAYKRLIHSTKALNLTSLIYR